MKRICFSVASLIAVLLGSSAATLAQTKPAAPTQSKAAPAAQSKPIPASRSDQSEPATPAQSRPAPASQGRSSTSPRDPRAASPVERDLIIFRDWVNDKLDKAENGARREWPKTMEEYDRQSARLDRAADSLSAQSRREYGSLKSRYNNWEANQRRLEEQANQPRTLQQTQNEMLGENTNLSRVRAAEMHDLYGRFIDYVRANRREWSEEDWAQAGAVLTRLNQRYEQVREQISMEERLRIRSWQAEFRTLEKAKQTKKVLDE